MKIFIALGMLFLISCTTKTKTKSDRELLKLNYWKLSKVELNNKDTTITKEDTTIHVFRDNDVLIFDLNGNFKNAFSYVLDTTSNITKLIINDHFFKPSNSYSLVAYDGFIQLAEVSSSNILKYSFVPVTDSLAVRKIRSYKF